MKDKSKHLHLSFSHTGDAFKYMEKDNGQEKSSEQAKVGPFHCFENWPDCVRAATYGWPEGLARVSALSAALLDKVGSGMIRETFTPNVSGLFFDVGLVLSGEPEAWLETTQTEEALQGPKLVTIGLNATVSFYVSGETIQQRGAAVLALVQLLEAAGRSVRVLVGCSLLCERKDYNLSATIQLKGFGEALDADKLAFWLVSEDAFRRCFFRIAEASPLWKRLGASQFGNYGRVQAGWIPEGSDIALEGLRSSEGWNPERARIWVEEQLRKQGVAIG